MRQQRGRLDRQTGDEQHSDEHDDDDAQAQIETGLLGA
jgi:hypothetical protein